jgi:hypothetical protein
MIVFVIAVAVGMGALAGAGLSGRWRTASWALALAIAAWALAGAAGVIAFGDPQFSFLRAIQHRHAIYAVALSGEAALAALALAAAGWREAKTRATVAAWLGCGWIGMIVALAR